MTTCKGPSRHNRGGSPSCPYVSSWPALIDKYLTYLISGHRIPAFVILLVAGVIVVQANRAGDLKALSDLLLTCTKCALFVTLYVIYQLVSYVYRRWGKRTPRLRTTCSRGLSEPVTSRTPRA
jgi:hypothetical protein